MVHIQHKQTQTKHSFSLQTQTKHSFSLQQQQQQQQQQGHSYQGNTNRETKPKCWPTFFKDAQTILSWPPL